jgi:phosphoribosylaminoimidazole-succinocarboxamide synthase
MGKKGQTVPPMTDDWVTTISKRYIELYEQLIGKKFIPQPVDEKETLQSIEAALKKINH